MKDMIEAKTMNENQNGSDPMSNLNDL
jgi:hypothetical protein